MAIDKQRFITARDFIATDMQREIGLARDETKVLRRVVRRLQGRPSGGGNFLAALGLLCYTEFAGHVMLNDFSNGSARRAFETFFPELGPEYGVVLKNHDVYGDLRCGLTHEYFVKKSCRIGMLSFGPKCGVQWDGQRYLFTVEAYWLDFQTAFQKLERDLYP